MRPGIRPNRLFTILILAALALSLSGCVYLRLFIFKNQLKEFDRNVSIEPAAGLSLAFPHPIVRDNDFTFITKSPPTQLESIATNTEVWTWSFEKRRAQPYHKPYSINFQTGFESGMLTRMIIDKSFVELLGREFILTMFRRVGDAKINTFKRSISASMDTHALTEVPLPTLAEIMDTMGQPTRIIETEKRPNQRLEYEYEFNFLNPENQKRAGQFKLAFKGDPLNPSAPVTGFRITGKGR